MEQVIATITDGDRVLVQDVAAWVHVNVEPSGLRSWHGYFELPQGSHLDVGGPYLLKTTDGRSGNILIVKVGMGTSHSTEVQFKGAGPFG